MKQGTPYGRFELLRKIAAGGMAEIFLARHWGQGGFFRDVVIKRLFKNFVEHEPTLRMFHYEAQLLAHLTHPNIPQVYDLGFADGTWFIAMEFVDGWNLADLWRMGARARKPMPLHVTLGIVLQMCEALNHAHDSRDRAGRPLRIVHRDVTPQNVMVTRDGVAKLMDFGAFVNILPGRDGLVHISQISKERVEKVSDVLKEGDVVRVKVLEVDKQGRIRLSIKALDEAA